MPTWLARLSGRGLAAEIVCPETGLESRTLADFLAWLDDDCQGWEGERKWQSEDAELRLTFSHPKTNTVEIGGRDERGCSASLELLSDQRG
jgi:hypothetical protein